MTDEHDNESEVFEVDRIRELIKLMHEFDLSEVDLRHTDRRIRLRKGGDPQPVFQAMPQMPQPQAPVMSHVGGTPSVPEHSDSSSSATTDDGNFEYIVSPMVGTFYTKPKPESDNFVKVGDTVSADTTVCLVEAMKMFNEIPAGISGKIVEVLVNNEEPVDVNKKLFKVAVS